MKNDTINQHPTIRYGKTGVLLVNLGTPDSTNWWDVRKYLKEFLSDRRVIEVNPFLWKFVLNCFILTFRPSKSAHAYKKIWMKEINESPLRHYTKLQTKKLSERISNTNVIVDFAMRYGNPSIKSKLTLLKDNQLDYTNTFDALTESLKEETVIPESLIEWRAKWVSLTDDNSYEVMRAANPRVIPRNHVIEEIIAQYNATGSSELLQRFIKIAGNPYSNSEELSEFCSPPTNDNDYQTFCGT